MPDDDDSPTIDGVARVRISDHIRECERRYQEGRAEVKAMKEEFARKMDDVQDAFEDAKKARFTLLMAVLVAAVSGVFQIILHFVPTGH